MALQISAIIGFFIFANGGNLRKVRESLRNALPSGLVALSTMSSAATLPLTLEAAEKNTKNKGVADVVVPATANIHHVGDSVGVPILIAAVYIMNGMDAMSYDVYLFFTLYYVTAKFGVASIPGGEVFVLAPILLGSQFGYTDSMFGLLTTLYILCDPFITVTNVMCNGALAILMDKICGRLKIFRSEKQANV